MNTAEWNQIGIKSEQTVFSLLFCIPFHLTTEIFDSFAFNKTIFRKLACSLPPAIYYTCDWVSILSVFTMALNRFIVLISPLRKSQLRQSISGWRTNLVLIGIIWTTSVAISFPNLLFLKLESICDLLDITRYYPTNHGTPNHVHWTKLGDLPCTEDFEILPNFTIQNWLDSTTNSTNPHENERVHQMLSTLLQCWTLDDIFTCTWKNEDAKLKYSRA